VATRQDRLEFRLLGPLEAARDGRPVPLGGPQVRGVLARLLVDLGRTVSVTALVDELWGERPPADAHRTTRSYVSRLRRAMAGPPRGGSGEVLVTRPPGYQLAVDPEAVDAVRFERLAAEGRRALAEGRSGPAHELLTEALALWRGTALAEFEGLPTVSCEAVRLNGLRLTAVEDRIEAGLAAGQHGPLVGELEELVRAHPVRERLRGQLMIALYRSGRQAEALGAFQNARSLLVEAFGVEPSPALVAIHQRILRQEPNLEPGTAPEAVPPAADVRAPGLPAPEGRVYRVSEFGVRDSEVRGPSGDPSVGDTALPVPAQLPFSVGDFIGRADELAQLDAALGAVPLTVISGTAGVGKTSLAVHWAHRVAPRFPDGQLYADLRGFDRDGSASDPADCVRGFLDALGLPLRSLPAGLQARSALFRSMLAGKRMLLVLDNARDAEQVRPLLPGSPGCLVVLTSRDQLTPLVVAQGAGSLRLDPLTAGQARELLICRLGRDRVAREPRAADEIAAHCAGLPLALAIAAARAAVRPGHPLSALSAQMNEAAARLDAFEGGDANTDVRSVFSWSYRTLGADAARLFRLLGLHPGPELSAAAAAGLAGCPLHLVGRSLAELCRANLLTEQTPGRYALHDLLRVYAAELAEAEEDPVTRQGAVHRVLDHYLHTAHAAALRLETYVGVLDMDGSQPQQPPAAFGSQSEALDWFLTEHRVLTDAFAQARDAGLDRYSWQLARACTGFLHRTNHWGELYRMQQVALAAARRQGDLAGQAHAGYGLALATRGLGRLGEAEAGLLASLDLFEQAGDHSGQALVHESLAWIAGAEGRHQQALDHARCNLDLVQAGVGSGGQASGDTGAEAGALNDLGWFHAQLGEYRQALVYCQRALALMQDGSARYCQGHTWDSLGYIHRCLGDHAEAVACYRRSLELFRQTGDLYSEADALANLGDTHWDAQDVEAARGAWRQALRHLNRLKHPDAVRVRAKLVRAKPVRAEPVRVEPVREGAAGKREPGAEVIGAGRIPSSVWITPEVCWSVSPPRQRTTPDGSGGL
jgi:DNA-binding SARP family transcriptional activator